MRHAFQYINVLRTDLGYTFKEITKYLDDGNYRTRKGLLYTEKQVRAIWNMRNDRFKKDYINYQWYIPKPEEIKLKKILLKIPIIPEEHKHDVLLGSLGNLMKDAYKIALNEAAKELKTKLQLEESNSMNVSVPRLTEALVKAVIKITFIPRI